MFERKINISIMKRFIILLIITAVLSSCGTSKYIEQSIKSLQSRIIQLENKNSILSSQIESIKRDNKELKKLIIERDKIDNVTSTQNIDTDETVRSTTTPIRTTSKSKRDDNTSKSVKTSRKRHTTKYVDTYSGRCQAITKKGTQCKRTAKAGSKYCWQHGG